MSSWKPHGSYGNLESLEDNGIEHRRYAIASEVCSTYL
jgi:hypothetical protein